ncbi:hypothetical protein [Streptomyces prasinus]|uniref:hypothetical protein n=1 Tax=Streptomyces prasinus TaxID=67345 RepID=UPI00368B4D28
MSHALGQPGSVPALSLIAVVGLLGMPVFQHVVVFAESLLPPGPAGLPLMYTALGVGTVLALPVVSGFEHRVGRAPADPVLEPPVRAVPGCLRVLLCAVVRQCASRRRGACFLVSVSLSPAVTRAPRIRRPR